MAPKQKIIRSKHHGCFQISESSAWGSYLVPTEDPEGQEVTEDDINGIKLVDNFPKLPDHLWSRFISLAFHYCPERKSKRRSEELEVSIVLLRRADDLTQWKIVVPEQKVTVASVEANFERNCDIETGEIYNQFPPSGWVHAGSAHSHNTMAAYFSHTDDENELGVPGMHIVIGKINKRERTYVPNASICLKRCRKTVEFDDVVDTSSNRMYQFHQNVLLMITEKQIEKKSGRWPTMVSGPGKSVLEKIDSVFDEDGYLSLDDDVPLFDLDKDTLDHLEEVTDEEIFEDANTLELSNNRDYTEEEEIEDRLSQSWWEEIEKSSENVNGDDDDTDFDERKW